MLDKIEYAIKSLDNGSIELSIDLKSYLNAYDEADNNGKICLKKDFKKKLHLEISTIWHDIYETLENSLQKKLDPEINNSVANSILKDDGFYELVKNVLDKNIERIIHNKDSSFIATLHISICDQSDVVSFIFKDFGKPFSEKFINMNSKELRADYVLEKKSHEKSNKCLGGNGLGLRQLMVKLDEGSCLEPGGKKNHRYLPPEKANILFENHNETNDGIQGGSIITIITSKKPLMPWEDTENLQNNSASSYFKLFTLHSPTRNPHTNTTQEDQTKNIINKSN